MKRAIVTALFFVLLSVSAIAQETTDITDIIGVDPGLTPDNPLYFVDPLIDNIRLALTPEEQKALVATEIHNERIAEVAALTERNYPDPNAYIISIDDAEDKSEIVETEIAPEHLEEVTDSTKKSIEVLTEVKERVPEEAKDAIKNAINRQIVKEKKTEIVAEITAKIDELCRTLIETVGFEKAVSGEPRCNPDIGDKQKWLRRARGKYIELDDSGKIKFIEEMKTCFRDPRECRCNEIPVKSFSVTCHKIIASVIKCTFEHDESACQRVGEISRESETMFEDLPDGLIQEMEKIFRERESEHFERFLPEECRRVGATTREACEQIMIRKFMPEECKQAGATTREACERILIAKYGERQFSQVPSECLRDGKFIGIEECQRIMFEKYLPPECKEAGAFTRESCEAVFKSKFGINRTAITTTEVVKTSFNIVQENVAALPTGCEGLTSEECSAKTGQAITPEIPLSFAIKEDGSVVPITANDIEAVVTTSEVQITEINAEEVKRMFVSDITILESGVQVLESRPVEEAVAAIIIESTAPTGSVLRVVDFVNRIK